MKRRIKRVGFISVGAFCQRAIWFFCVLVERVVLLMLRLRCLVKRREALRGRNLSRDSQVKGAPTVHPTSDMHVASEVVFLPPVGHPCHASKNPSSKPRKALTSGVRATSSGYRHYHVVALDSRGGIGVPIQRRRSGATRRVDSSLRSHRTRRSHCRRVSSGLNKTWSRSPTRRNAPGAIARADAGHYKDSASRHRFI